MTDFIEKTFGSYLISTVDLDNNDILTLYSCYGAGNLNTAKYIDSSLRGYYEFNDVDNINPSIEALVEDSSIYGNDGIFFGSAFVSGGILELNGTTDGVNLVASNVLFPSDNSWTQSLWFQSDMGDTTISNGFIFTGLRDASGGVGATIIRFRADENKLELAYRDSGNNFSHFNGPSMATLGSTWHHVVVTYNGTTFIMYIDGELFDTQVDDFYGFGSEIAYIGYNTFPVPTTSDFFDGRLDNLMIFDRDLSLSEIQYLYSIQNKIEGFSSTLEKIMIGGIPLSLSKYNGSFINTFNESGDIYAINIIERSNISGESLSCVWNGNLLGITKDSDSRYNLDIAGKNNSSIPIHNVILFGFPLGTEENNGLILMNSGYSTSDIEEYEKISLGGMPLNVGRINENWYLIVNMAQTY